MDRRKLFEELEKNSKNIRFSRICKIAEAFGFKFRGGKGSHRIYVQKGINEMLNFQNVNGKTKPYQVKQFIKIIIKYNLIEEGDSNV